MISPVRVAGLELDRLLSPQSEGSLQARAHVDVGVADSVQCLVQSLGFVLITDVVALGDTQQAVVLW